jgi:hypothetical protein
MKGRDALRLSHLRDTKNLWITGIKLSTSLTPDWLPALLMSTSTACRRSVESVYLSFALETLKDMDRVAWGEIEHALSLTLCPRLQNIRICFTVLSSGLTQVEVAKRLPELASRGTVEIV